MKVMYRPVRGSFEEAMAEKKEFKRISLLKQFLAGRPTIEYYTNDSRLPGNGDTFIIMDGGHPYGYVWYEEGEAE